MNKVKAKDVKVGDIAVVSNYVGLCTMPITRVSVIDNPARHKSYSFYSSDVCLGCFCANAKLMMAG